MNVNSVFWRRLAYAGARYGPVAWVRFSPALFGLAFAAAEVAQLLLYIGLGQGGQR